MKFKIKNCPECAYWNSPQRFEPKEFCVYHEDKEDQPPAIIKAIKEVKKERWIARIICWFPALALYFFTAWSFINLFVDQKTWLIMAYSIILTVCIVFLSLAIWVIVDIEKDFKKELKELQKKKDEWIIEYDKTYPPR